MKLSARRTTAMVLAATCLVLAACGDDDEESTPTDAPAATGASDETDETDAPAATDAPPETDAPAVTDAPVGTDAPAGGDDLSALAAECEAEGNRVNLIALPDEWANYEGILQSFRDKYPGIENPVANPNASSREEMEAVQTLAGQDDMPDNVDVSPAIAQEMKDAGLFEPYIPTVIDEIPEGLVDVDNNYTAAYYGVIAILTNTTIVPNAPTTFADLMKPEYEGLVSINGDPRKSGAAFAAVMAASFANGGSADDIMPGIEFFAELDAIGNLGSSDITPASVLSGETSLGIDWSYNLPGLEAQLADAGFTYETHFPTDAVYGGFYGQGVVKDSPHQACSKLWLEHILSDEGALGYLAGGAMPARFEALVEAGLVDDAAMENLPSADLIAQVEFLTPTQIADAARLLDENWGPMVADN